MLILYIPKINPKQGELTYKSDSAPNHFAYTDSLNIYM